MKALDRMATLDLHVDLMSRHGFAKTTEIDPFTVDIREERPAVARPRHRAYLILTVLSFGFGAVLWLMVIRDHQRQRRRQREEPFQVGTWRVHVSSSGEIETYELLTEEFPPEVGPRGRRGKHRRRLAKTH